MMRLKPFFIFFRRYIEADGSIVCLVCGLHEERHDACCNSFQSCEDGLDSGHVCKEVVCAYDILCVEYIVYVYRIIFCEKLSCETFF
jgi:hypothetical protein